MRGFSLKLTVTDVLSPADNWLLFLAVSPDKSVECILVLQALFSAEMDHTIVVTF